MISNQYTPSRFLAEYQTGIEKIIGQHKDEFHNKLYFSNVISLMEKYLYDVFVYEISTNRTSLIKLASQNKFRTESLKIPYLLQNSVENFLINAVKNFVWHRLNDIDVFYKNVLGITFNLNKNLLAKLKVRHDIVHRNGFDLQGNTVSISDQELNDCITVIILIKSTKQKRTKYLNMHI
jgi:hypothetical protein